jgi:hypothetical protein
MNCSEWDTPRLQTKSVICLAASLLYLCGILSMLSGFCVIIHDKVDGLMPCVQHS